MRASLLVSVLALSLMAGFASAQITPPRRTDPPRPPVIMRAPPVEQAAPTACHDCDGDGHNAPGDSWHGAPADDCDDHDANRYPTNHEVANAGHDEDCDPHTFGVLDADHDGYTSDAIYNTAPDGRRFGGDDCNDNEPAIRPDAQELPNRLDDNCDGRVDNLLGTWWTPPAR